MVVIILASFTANANLSFLPGMRLPKAFATSGYDYSPAFNATGSNLFDIPNHSSLQLTLFSAAAWFKTTKDHYTEQMIVNKGGIGLETAGNNMNYGIWMDSAEKIRGGFETSIGTDYIAASSSTYNDGSWHYAVVTYDGSIVRLYVDGMQVGTKITSTTPDTGGSQPLRIGANSQALNRYFKGDIDEVRVWDRAITATEASDQYLSGIINTTGQRAYLGMQEVPVADSGPIQLVMDNATQASLDARSSFDPDSSGTLTYLWIQTSGPTVTLSDPSVANPSFAVLNVTGEVKLTFQVKVSDGQYSSVDKVDIYIADMGIVHKVLQTPGYRNDLVNEIRNAKQFVYANIFYVETYDTNRVIDELVNATKRGVDVRLIFDPHTQTLYPNTDETLAKLKIPFKIIPSHAKVVVIDNKTAYVGSANWNHNGLDDNWELSMKTNNPDTISEAYEYVNKLWNTGSKVTRSIDKYYERFTTGNEYYDLLMSDLKNANSIKVLMFEATYNFENPNALDSMLLQEVKNAYDRGANLKLLLDDPRYLEVTRGPQFLTQNNVPFKVDNKNSGFNQKVHAKAILIDDQILFIGSHNWSDDSLGSLGETTIITRHPQTISDFQAIFDAKWSLGHFP